MLSKTTMVAAMTAVMLSGCENVIHKMVDIDSGKGLSLDAQQRLLLVTEKGGLPGEDFRVVCAEPGPDAITSRSVALSASGGTPKVGASLGFGSSGAAASIGLRTQTIQLLRDGYYRLCEAYMNGALSKEQYNFALVNIDKLIIPLMAIDAIAGTPRPPAVVIAPGNPGSSADTDLVGKLPGGDNTAAQPASLDSGATVGSTSTVAQIETINQTRVGLNKDEAGVLKQALALLKDTSTHSLCITYLADPHFTTGELQSEYQHSLAKKCELFVAAMFDEANRDLRGKLESANNRAVELSGKLNLKNQEVKSASDALVKSYKQQIQTTKDLAVEVSKQPSVIVK